MTRFTAISGAFLVFLITFSNLFAAQNFPYTAQIIESEAIVYSSPGTERYETQRLKAGDKVEVYQINPDNWCAIRPPLGSFSWICGLYVEAGLNNIGVVTVDQLSSRVGSQFGDTCKTVQVQLEKGERVILLERVETPTNTASPVWYKIVPPSGEFRWIHLNSLSTGARLAKPLPRPQANHNGKIIQASYGEPLADSDFELTEMPVPDPMQYDEEPFDGALLELAESDPLEAPNLEGMVATRRFSDNTNLQRPGFDRAPQQYSQQQYPPQQYTQQQYPQQQYPQQSHSHPIFNPSLATMPRGGQGAAMMPVPSDPYQRALAQLNQEIHAAMSRPTEDWMFDTMIQKGKMLMERAPTEYDRTRAMQMVQVLEKTRSIRKTNAFRREQSTNFSGGKLTQSVLRGNATPTTPATSMATPQAAPTLSQALPQLGTSSLGTPSIGTPATAAAYAANPASSVASPAAPPASDTIISAAATAAPNTSPYKAVGRLGWFSQRPEGCPPYALVDEQGKIVSYVTPQPGVDLKPYINKQVGVNGTSGVYIGGNQRAPHIGASAVFPIN